VVAGFGDGEDNKLLGLLQALTKPVDVKEAVMCSWCDSAKAVFQCEECVEPPAESPAADPTCPPCPPEKEPVPYCMDCDKVLHLHKKKKAHRRTPIMSSSDETMSVDANEGTARVKLSLLMVVADTMRWKSVVEFKAVAHGAQECRFCEMPLTAENMAPPMARISPALEMCCNQPDCLEARDNSCDKILPCGHPCCGVKGEEKCLPCLHCGPAEGELALTQDADDYCVVCYTDAISRQPSVQLDCGHVIHYACIRRLLEMKWNGPIITFGFRGCPQCRTDISHKLLEDLTGPIEQLHEKVTRKALARLQYDNLQNSSEIVEPGGRYFEDPEGFAMHRYAYYICHKCEEPFYGGAKECGAARGDDWDASELICGSCSGTTEQYCPKHGGDYLEFKCRFCCSIAIWFCFGTTHFCEPCHNRNGECTSKKKEDMPHCPVGPVFKQLEGECPLKIKHPPTGEEFALGCGVCRNAATF
jgi:E3 ubiquitin-protein ligase MYCBP2